MATTLKSYTGRTWVINIQWFTDHLWSLSQLWWMSVEPVIHVTPFNRILLRFRWSFLRDIQATWQWSPHTFNFTETLWILCPAMCENPSVCKVKSCPTVFKWWANTTTIVNSSLALRGVGHNCTILDQCNMVLLGSIPATLVSEVGIANTAQGERFKGTCYPQSTTTLRSLQNGWEKSPSQFFLAVYLSALNLASGPSVSKKR